MIYFLQGGPGDLVKIGYVEDACRVLPRKDELQRNNPRILELILLLPGGRHAEQRLHEIHAGYNYRGEWFAPEVLTAHGICMGCSKSFLEQHTRNGAWYTCADGSKVRHRWVPDEITEIMTGIKMPPDPPIHVTQHYPENYNPFRPRALGVGS